MRLMMTFLDSEWPRYTTCRTNNWKTVELGSNCCLRARVKAAHLTTTSGSTLGTRTSRLKYSRRGDRSFGGGSDGALGDGGDGGGAMRANIDSS